MNQRIRKKKLKALAKSIGASIGPTIPGYTVWHDRKFRPLFISFVGELVVTQARAGLEEAFRG